MDGRTVFLFLFYYYYYYSFKSCVSQESDTKVIYSSERRKLMFVWGSGICVLRFSKSEEETQVLFDSFKKYLNTNVFWPVMGTRANVKLLPPTPHNRSHWEATFTLSFRHLLYVQCLFSSFLPGVLTTLCRTFPKYYSTFPEYYRSESKSGPLWRCFVDGNFYYGVCRNFHIPNVTWWAQLQYTEYRSKAEDPSLVLMPYCI